MKNLIFVAALFGASFFQVSSALASDFCVGDSVISENGIYGSVVGIYESTGQLSVQYTTESTPRSQDPSALAHTAGTLGDFKVGDSVLSDNGIYGQVVGIYESSGLLAVQYTTESTPRQQNPNALAYLHGQASGFSVGQSVISSNGIQGQVVGIYENGQLAVQYVTESNPRSQDPSTLAVESGCEGTCN